jgi:hypothetical protein
MPVFFATTLMIAAGGCSDVLGNDGLGITITFSDSVVTPDQPVTVTVTVMNLGDSVVWGRGSSSCQLGALVLTDMGEHRVDVGRLCTEDFGPQGLAQGESRTEQWPWAGEATIDGMTSSLLLNTYGVVAVAGTVLRSEPRVIRIGSGESP